MKMTVTTEENTLVLEFIGEIDEEAQFSPLSFDQIKSVVFNFEKVTLLNSSGLRVWINWIKDFPHDVVKVFKNCPRMVVDQMNILDGFIPKNSIIESFYVPYYCQDCEEEKEILAVRGEDFMPRTTDFSEAVSPKDDVKCPKCGSDMELDVLPQKYFQFLKHK